MEDAHSSKMSVNSNHTIRHHIPEISNDLQNLSKKYKITDAKGI
jgi:hypothetical protein